MHLIEGKINERNKNRPLGREKIKKEREKMTENEADGNEEIQAKWCSLTKLFIF